mgnify:CR=1 FL=1
MKLYNYFRSSASFRVRIALHLKGLSYEYIPVHLAKGEHKLPSYSAVAADNLVPNLVVDGEHLSQSLAIMEYLDETHPTPALLPKDPLARARVRALAQSISCEIHPINNLRVLRYLIKKLGINNEAKDEWYQHWVKVGLESIEKQLSNDSRVGRFAYGDQPGLIDICLVPQLFNALSAKVDVEPYPTLMSIFHECMKLPAFIDASWEKQIDAEGLNPVAPPQK